MDDGRLSHHQIDDVLSGCRKRIRRDPSVIVNIEHMVLALDYCLDNLEPRACERHLKENALEIADSLTGRSIDAFNYETLRALPRVLDAAANMMQGRVSGVDERVMGLVDDRLAFHRHLLGEIPIEDVPARYHGELAEYTGSRQGIYTHLVFVSRAPGNQRRFDIAKVLRARLDANLIGEWSLTRSFEPIIGFEKRILEYRDPFAVQLRRAVYLAEDLAVARQGLKELRKIPREYRFGVSAAGDGPDWAELFTGGSAGLGFAMLSLAGIGSFELHRSAVTVSPDCAFTGSLGDNGVVTEVEDSDIPAKTRAVFYSACRKFMLPAGNIATAARELEGLEAAHPGRKLELEAVESARDLAESGEVFKERRVSSWSVAKGRIKRRRKHSIIAACLVIIAALAVTLVPPVFDHEISDFRLESDEVELINRFGVQFDSYPLGYHVNVKDNDYDSYAARSHRFRHADVDGDGRKELLLISVESAPNENRATGKIHVHLFDSDGGLRNEKILIDTLALVGPDSASVYREPLLIGPDSTAVYRNFTYNWDVLDDLDADGFKELVVGSVDISEFPGIICSFSLRDGRSQIFVHGGHMIRFVTGDFDRDGRKEIVAGGESDVFDSAVLAVLDPLHMEGVSPETGFTIESLPSDDIAIMYIRLPASRLRSIIDGCKKPFIDRVLVSPEQTIRLSVFESADRYHINSMNYYIGRNWECYLIKLHSSYKDCVADHYGMSMEALQDTFDVYKDEMMEGLRYWDGKEWVAEPTLNPGYLEVIERQQGPSSFDD